MHRFFVSPSNIQGEWVKVDSSQTRHIQTVLRLKPGDYIGVFDGQGREYVARLEVEEGENLMARISSEEKRDIEPRVRLNLIQAVAKGEKMDFIIQKAVEIGVANIYPVISQRSVVRLEGERAVKKVERWQAIAREACKQCGRNHIPNVYPLQTLTQCIDMVGAQKEQLIMLYEGSQGLGLGTVLKEEIQSPGATITILVGPEGGFAPQEVDLARQAGVLVAGLGPRILRTETAALVAGSIILYEYGEMG